MDLTPTWHDRPLATFDLETTSPEPHEAKIVSFAFAVVEPDGTLASQTAAIVKPDGWTIPEGAAAVHGITTEIAERDGIEISTALSLLRKHFLDCLKDLTPLVIYNAPYDLTVLGHAFVEHFGSGGDGLIDVQRVIDPLVIDKHWDKWRKGSRKLEDTARFYGVTLDGAHDAFADAIAAERLARALHQRHRLIATDPLVLHKQQAEWYATQSASYERYLRTKKGQPDAVIDRSWPRKRLAQTPQEAQEPQGGNAGATPLFPPS